MKQGLWVEEPYNSLPEYVLGASICLFSNPCLRSSVNDSSSEDIIVKDAPSKTATQSLQVIMT